jgi:hypothetical protein
MVMYPSPHGSVDDPAPSPGSYEHFDVETIEETADEAFVPSNELDDDLSEAPPRDVDPQ